MIFDKTKRLYQEVGLKIFSLYLRCQKTDQKGQAMAEYVILVVLVSLALIPMFTALPDAVRGYLRPIYYCVSRPLP